MNTSQGSHLVVLRTCLRFANGPISLRLRLTRLDIEL